MLGAGPLNWLFFRAGSLLEHRLLDELGWRVGRWQEGRFRPAGRNHDVESGRMQNRNLVYVVDDDTSMLKGIVVFEGWVDAHQRISLFRQLATAYR